VKYVLDTNAVSAIMKADTAFLSRLQGVPRPLVFVPEPALAEIAYGIERLPKSKKKNLLIQRYALVRAELQADKWTETVSDAFGRIKAMLERRGQRIEDIDIAIAAHATGDDAVLVSADTGDMQRIPGIKVEDWSLPPKASGPHS
jgi:tRNA(fMet)-specific endonuclease VapC